MQSLSVDSTFALDFECDADGYHMSVELYRSGEFEGVLHSTNDYVYGEVDGFYGTEFEGIIYQPDWLSGYVYCYR